MSALMMFDLLIYPNHGSYYSVLKLFTGFAIAALIAWKLIVATAIITASKPVAINIHALILVRYAKSLSQLFVAYHAMGEARINAITTSLIKSFESNNTRLETDAPNTFLTPISLNRCCTVYADSPNNPKQASAIAIPAKRFMTVPSLISALYNLL